MLNPWGRLTRNRKTLTRRTWALLEDAGREAGVPVRVTQGSWARGRRSAGTHAGAGAFDLNVYGMSESQILRFVHALRKRNTATWYRAPKYGWPSRLGGAHIHGIVKDEPGLSPAARRQVIYYNRGLNGLASSRRDPFARPKQTPFAGAPAKVTQDVKVYLSNLRYGKTNDDVRDLQQALGITRDGVYGPKTDSAVRAHQRRIGLVPDPARKSYVGPKQAAHLGLKVI